MRAGGRLVIAADGKTVRGAKSKNGKAPHLVAALVHGTGAVLGQVAADAKSNEIPAVRELLKAFTGLAGAVFTIDAMHTQHDTARAILARQADYVMTVKANMPTLYRQLKKLPWAGIPAVSSVSTDHGRRARRTVKAALAPAWIGFEGAAQVAQLRRTVTKKGQEDRRGCLPDHQRPRRRPGRPCRLDPRPLAHREQALLGPRRHLPGRQVPGRNRERAPRHGVATWSSACFAWTAAPAPPPPTAAVPATRSARSNCFRPREGVPCGQRA